MGKSSSINSSNTKAKVAERLAFDPFLPQQDLINEFIRNTITPDNDIGQTYYLGKVIDIIDTNNSEIDIRDIFYSPSDNYQRATKATTEKKTNTNRKMLLVHIPSFLTNASNTTSKKLNYNSFTKIRVDYDEKDPVEIGYLVKIQFRNKDGFYDPYVVGVEKLEKDYINQIEPAIEEFKKYQNCKITNFTISNNLNNLSTNSNTRPAGGYIQALSELNNVFSTSYIDSFKKIITQTEFGDFNKIVIRANIIQVDASVYADFEIPKNYSYRLSVATTNQTNNYLIFGEDIIISCEKPEKNNDLKDKFYDYVKSNFDSRFGYTFSKSEGNKFVVDINSNFLVNENKKSVEQYISISKIYKDFNSVATSVLPGKSTDKNASAQSIKPLNTIDKCDADISKDKSNYQLVYDKKPTKDLISSDSLIIQKYYDDQISKTDSYIEKEYLYKLANDGKDISEQDFLNSIQKKNKKFYSSKEQNSNQNTNDRYGKNEKNYLNVGDIPNNFSKISSFLKALKKQIETLETLKIDEPIKSEYVLVLPVQVLKIKPNQALSSQNDKNSRHYYGKAFDIRVYIVSFQGGKKIYQIPPEIVALYANLLTVRGNQTIGHGIFLDKKKRYNHIEFLEDPKTIGLPQEEWNQKLLFTGGSDAVEKAIDSVPSGKTRFTKLKEIVRQGSSYVNPTTKRLDPRFELLTDDNV